MDDLQSLKRKRSSPSISSPAPPLPKIARTNPTALQINYLARQSPQDLPLINKNENIPNTLDVLAAYTSVLDRHESLASNLGARPLGPILIKRFERCFDAPPDIIASHSHARDGTDTPQVTWLEVIQFAQSHPSQFTLTTFSEGRRVCQFYFPQKQVRVQVSEEDYLFIKSGRCQDLIPPLPIWEDEEKEVGTCEILEKQLRELTNAADTVAARTRQLAHRLKSRRMAIMERRAGEKNGNSAESQEPGHEHFGVDHIAQAAAAAAHANIANGQHGLNGGASTHIEPTADVNVRSDLLRHFQSLSQNQTPTSEASKRHPSVQIAAPSSPPRLSTHRQEVSPPFNAPQPASRLPERPDPLSYYLAESAPPPPVMIPNSSRPTNPAVHSPTNANHTSSLGLGTSKHNFSRPLAPGAEIAQPFRSVCQAHMEALGRGARVMPPCDRCRRLKMDCLKNLTSCQGCTKKHARCHWRDVERSEVEGLEGFGVDGGSHGSGASRSRANTSGTAHGSGGSADESEDEGMGALEDLEALDRQGDEVDSAHTADKMDIDNIASASSAGNTSAVTASRPSSAIDPSSHVKREDIHTKVALPAGPEQASKADGRPVDIFRSSLPYPHTAASTAPTASVTSTAPSSSMPPPPRERQGSYGFPHPSHSSTPSSINTKSDKPASSTHSHVHVATPHPSYRPSAFTSVNANVFTNNVNGDSSITDETAASGFRNPFASNSASKTSVATLTSPPQRREHDFDAVRAATQSNAQQHAKSEQTPAAATAAAAGTVASAPATGTNGTTATVTTPPHSSGHGSRPGSSQANSTDQHHPLRDGANSTTPATTTIGPPPVVGQGVAVGGASSGPVQGWRGA